MNLLFKNEIIDNTKFKVWCNKEFIPLIVESLVQDSVKIYSLKEKYVSLEDVYLERIGGNNV